MNFDLNLILKIIWIGLTFSALLTEYIPIFQSIALHGKCQNQRIKKIIKEKQTFSDLIHKKCQLSKSYFIHLYIIGLLSSIIILLYYYIIKQNNYQIIITLFLFIIHNIRRIYECKYYTIYGKSTMHIGGYLAGILHYILVPLTIITIKLSTFSIFLFFIAIILFFLANLIQFHSHFILYQIKLKNLNSSKNTIYSLPTQSFFSYVCCPHYTAEILLYFSFFLLLNYDITMFLLLLWVVVNLSIVSNKQYNWYHQHFPKTIPTNWKRIIPGLW